MMKNIKNYLNQLAAAGKYLLSCSSCSCSLECKAWQKVLLAFAIGFTIGLFVFP